MNQDDLQRRLRFVVPALRWRERTLSTNDDALGWAADDAPDGALVIADQQTAGRGRLDRSWLTPPGCALAFSLILRPTPEEQERISLFAGLGALAVQSALKCGGACLAQVKWPNDMLLNRRKVCGILVESTWIGAEAAAVVVGIGINVAPLSVPPAHLVRYPASCVESETGQPVERLELLQAVLERFFAWRSRLCSPEFLAEWERQLAYRGEQVQVETGAGEKYTGTLLGLTPDGGLRLQNEAGVEIQVIVGDLSLRPLQV